MDRAQKDLNVRTGPVSLRPSAERVRIAQGGAWCAGYLLDLSHSEMRVSLSLSVLQIYLGPEVVCGYCRVKKLVAALHS